MELPEFDTLVDESRDRQDELLTVKGQDYTRGNPNRLANFYRWAGELDVHPFKVLGVLMGKHVDSVVSYIKTGGQLESEPIEKRLDDLHNYLSLFEAMIKDVEKAVAAAKLGRRRVRKVAVHKRGRK